MDRYAIMKGFDLGIASFKMVFKNSDLCIICQRRIDNDKLIFNRAYNYAATYYPLFD